MTHNKVVKHVGRKRPSSTEYEKRKMTTEEFVEAVNAIDNWDGIKANVVGDGYVEILRKTLLDNGYVDSVTLAWLPDKTNGWVFRGDLRYERPVIPTKILKLMVDLAESRADDNKYVILNGKQFLFEENISTRAFLIIDNSLSSRIISIDDLVNVSYTKEELEQLKSTLPKKLQEAVDLLTVTVGEAKKVLKHDN